MGSMIQTADRVSQTVLLAAGLGVRLGAPGATVPKPLIAVASLPLIAHALAHAAASGCDEAVIVIGHEGARVRAAVEAMPPVIAVRFVESRDPTTPNGESLLAAEPWAADRFFLQMVDHLFAEPVLTRLASPALDGDTAGRGLVDRSPGRPALSVAPKGPVPVWRGRARG